MGRVVARHYQEWYAAHAGLAGAEVHVNPDITWMIQDGVAWQNGGTGLRFSADTVDARLDAILATFRSRGSPTGFWVDADATPADLEAHLKKRRFRCRKYFPGMWCDLSTLPAADVPTGLTFAVVNDHALYREYPHPYFGRISTAIRRFEMKRLIYLTGQRPQRIFDFAAFSGRRPVGACTMFLGESAAGFHDVGVLVEERRKGLGSALMAHALRFAHDHGSQQAVLVASGMGSRMYQHVGFREVCQMGFWYRA